MILWCCETELVKTRFRARVKIMRDIKEKAIAAREASRELAYLDTDSKNTILCGLADSLVKRKSEVLAANAVDMQIAKGSGLPSPKLKRLQITEAGLNQMAEGLRIISRLPDPVGAVVKDYRCESGLHVQKVRIPLGVVAMIYEARPNVTIDAFGLCFKAGNACFLKGGKEADKSNALLALIAKDALKAGGVTEGAVEVMVSSDREELRYLLGLNEYIDLVIPRGGTALIEFVHQHSRIPMVQHFHGVCHIYIDEFADPAKAAEIAVTAKTSAPATCNSAECVLVHKSVAERFLPVLGQRYLDAGVEIRGDDAVCSVVPHAVAAADDDWGREFLDLIVAMKVVDGIDAAIGHIAKYGSNHTDVIVSDDGGRQAEFIRRVGSSCVLVNASSRFNDGFQLGLGAEIGISTSKIHAYGPMGLEELTTSRYVVHGDGQVR